ncbi:glycosyl hydrolase 53 family protein [Bradyrhizobium huanghuaihaiense]|uniref:glycosyl hydrolase 53 family protein n=1 Tax=Bradyrhizobium huanghuaihaiense TaxID=990078 RepID=UPI0021AA8839|nr:glycosyl hydrolase 53 family protein [Bradyrhizobium sp. CB3035]UWU75156.1 glycosyl hydrolase 53 family protein [Bradyrhizobium sp. CB3035]
MTTVLASKARLESAEVSRELRGVRNRMRWNFLWKISALLFVAVTSASMSSSAEALEWGLNGPAAMRKDPEPFFRVMKERGFTVIRWGVNLTKDNEQTGGPAFAKTFQLAKAYGIRLQPVFGFPFRWGDRTDAGLYPAGDREALYQQGYNRTYAFVKQFKNEIDQWELENEINLVARDRNDKRLFGQGMTAAEFEMPAMEDWAAVLRGASDAIDRINQESGLHLKKILNTTSTMFGFLDFMESRGVHYDLISYHYYEVLGQDMRHAWNGWNPRFDLFKKLASYRRHVLFNEVNCGEIYKPDYGNAPGDAATERCLRNLNGMLTAIRDQKDVVVDAINIYQIVDEPAKKPPENRFGLMYDLDRPKVALYLVSRFAGGKLTPEEAAELQKRGF